MPLTKTQLRQIADILLEYEVDMEIAARTLDSMGIRKEAEAKRTCSNQARSLFAVVLYEMGESREEA